MIRFFAVMLLVVSLLALHGRADTSDKEKEQAIVNSLGMQFVPVPIPDGKPVLMCIWKTRVKDFDAFVSETHYDATREMHSLSHDGKGENNAANWKRPGFDQTELSPVCGINYEDAIAFCAWLTKKESKHYRLPTDHEWSCAVGIGDKEQAGDAPRSKDRKIEGVYPWGTQWPPPKGAGNYAGEECRGQKSLPSNATVIAGYQDGFIFTSPVGSFDANRLGIFDLGGNLWEWCDDWVNSAKKERVLRGGSWGDDLPACLLASYRRHETPRERGNIFGFRVVMTE